MNEVKILKENMGSRDIYWIWVENSSENESPFSQLQMVYSITENICTSTSSFKDTEDPVEKYLYGNRKILLKGDNEFKMVLKIGLDKLNKRLESNIQYLKTLKEENYEQYINNSKIM